VPPEFKPHMGKLKYVPKGGADKKGCLELEDEVTEIKIDVPIDRFPFLVTWRYSVMAGPARQKSSWTAQSYWLPMRDVVNLGSLKSRAYVRFNPGQNQSVWYQQTDYFSGTYVDCWADGGRISLTFGQPEQGGRVTLTFFHQMQIDDVTIRSISSNELPDVSAYLRLVDKIPVARRKGTTVIPELKADTPEGTVAVEFVTYLEHWAEKPEKQSAVKGQQ
jgi:hypothetical protein